VNFVAQAMAGELLAEPGAAADASIPTLANLTAPLPAEEHERDREPESDEPQPQQPWRHGALLPVVVVLRDLAAQLPNDGTAVGADNVWQYICGLLKTASQFEFAPALKDTLREGKALVMFDGLDEVPDAHQRREQIKKVVLDFAESFSHCRILVTSRTYAYTEQAWKLPGFVDAELSPFGMGQILAFVNAWYASTVENFRFSEDDAKGRAAVLMRQVQHNPRVRELAERPLLLTLFVRLQSGSDGNLPERREELYFAAVDMLLNEWERGKVRLDKKGRATEMEPSLSEWLDASPIEIRKQLNALAFAAHQDQKDLEGTASIAQADLVAALTRASTKLNNLSAEERLLKLHRLQGYLQNRAGLLAEHGVGTLQFPHRTFQEYLAACHLANDNFPDKLADLVRADPLRWREVTLLAAAHAARGNSSLPTWALTEALCRTDVGQPGASPPASKTEAERDAWGALLAGEVLVATDEHKAPASQHIGKRNRVRDWQVALLTGTRLPAIERALADRILNVLGDPRPEVMTLDGMQFCWVSAGPFVMGSAKDDTNAMPSEFDQHAVHLDQPYYMARFPVTVAQWREWLAMQPDSAQDAHVLGDRDADPVVNVNWHEAEQFCEVLTLRWKRQLPPGMVVALPSEAEWENAARGGAVLPPQRRVVQVEQLRADVATAAPVAMAPNPLPARQYPWDNQFESELTNAGFELDQTSAVGCFAAGASPYGCEDMAGNVLEWTRSAFADYPFNLSDPKRDGVGLDDEDRRVVRGGAWNVTTGLVRCAFRNWVGPGSRLSFLGFRVVLRSAPVKKR
jgi:formylglycine-generating enzyme required for sulfatase activity